MIGAEPFPQSMEPLPPYLWERHQEFGRKRPAFAFVDHPPPLEQPDRQSARIGAFNELMIEDDVPQLFGQHTQRRSFSEENRRPRMIDRLPA